MYNPMTAEQLDQCFLACVYQPASFQGVTPGLFASRFGVPSAAQLAELGGLLEMDARCRFCATSKRPDMAGKREYAPLFN